MIPVDDMTSKTDTQLQHLIVDSARKIERYCRLGNVLFEEYAMATRAAAIKEQTARKERSE